MGTALTVKSDLAKRLETFEEFLTLQEWHIQAIKEGIAAADKGDFVGHDEAIAELKRKWPAV